MDPKDFKNYIGHSAYKLKYHKSEGNLKTGIAFGKILSVSEENGEIIHDIDSGKGSIGSPILNLNNLKVFGIHGAFNRLNGEKYGKMINFVVDKFKAQYILRNK